MAVLLEYLVETTIKITDQLSIKVAIFLVNHFDSSFDFWFFHLSISISIFNPILHFKYISFLFPFLFLIIIYWHLNFPFPFLISILHSYFSNFHFSMLICFSNSAYFPFQFLITLFHFPFPIPIYYSFLPQVRRSWGPAQWLMATLNSSVVLVIFQNLPTILLYLLVPLQMKI